MDTRTVKIPGPDHPITVEPARTHVVVKAGGRVVADWPSLADNALYENRDLKPTTDLRAVMKGILRDHLRADERVLASTVFPGSEHVKPLAGLLA